MDDIFDHIRREIAKSVKNHKVRKSLESAKDNKAREYLNTFSRQGPSLVENRRSRFYDIEVATPEEEHEYRTLKTRVVYDPGKTDIQLKHNLIHKLHRCIGTNHSEKKCHILMLPDGDETKNGIVFYVIPPDVGVTVFTTLYYYLRELFLVRGMVMVQYKMFGYAKKLHYCKNVIDNYDPYKMRFIVRYGDKIFDLDNLLGFAQNEIKFTTKAFDKLIKKEEYIQMYME